MKVRLLSRVQFPSVVIILRICNGNRTERSPIRSVIIITSMITDRIGRHEVLLPINHNLRYNRLNRNSKFCFASSEKKKPFKRARDGAYRPIT